ncbi:hypothetical protein HYH03_010767 [Edaphochlamys debaryana]|uniref:alpha-1,2-Mannosidase n=1 Tax=Edaphochlamys debaryana TaxID=47281 RepID=A0A835Y4G2_9CHLO|nr:hypothetical protein HYH03_010767 [Edaphochlamys debaryana]|eukprot:KAG2490849.1 hypothetical protein HYH03_010767 [Edaphochlamys debaryana]
MAAADAKRSEVHLGSTEQASAVGSAETGNAGGAGTVGAMGAGGAGGLGLSTATALGARLAAASAASKAAVQAAEHKAAAVIAGAVHRGGAANPTTATVTMSGHSSGTDHTINTGRKSGASTAGKQLESPALAEVVEAAEAPPTPEAPDTAPHPLRHHPHKDKKYRIYKLPEKDVSPRCQKAQICDGNYECGPDGLGCIQDAAQRKEKVRDAAKWTWKGYRQFAWGHDELNAGSRNSREWFSMGLTIVDSLDTLQILGMLEEYAEARHWVINHLDLNQGEVSFFETTIRILGGLAAAYYHSGGDEAYLIKMVEFADRLMPAFNTSTGLPVPHFNVHDKDVANYRGSVGGTCLAEAGTLSMEFSAATRISGYPGYREAAMKTWQVLAQLPNTDGLMCTMLNGDSLTCNGNHYTFGAAADSTYEYMLKQWILTNGTDQITLDLYKKALRGMRRHMLTDLWMGDDIGMISIVAESDSGMSRQLLLEHLTCFLPGTMALGHMYGVNSAENPEDDDDLMVAVKLMRACYELYHHTASGVAWDSIYYVQSPEPQPVSQQQQQQQAGQVSSAGSQASARQLAFQANALESLSNRRANAGSNDINFGGHSGADGQQHKSSGAQVTAGGLLKRQDIEGNTFGGHGRRLLQAGTSKDGWARGGRAAGLTRYAMQPRSNENFLRPEVAEALFYLWRATGDPIYREWGWNMFRAYERFCRVDSGGYQVLSNVNSVPPGPGNKMESFWMAETMKYFYLLFSDDPLEVPLDEFVFNTEAHPLAIWGSRTDKRMREALKRFRERTGLGGDA